MKIRIKIKMIVLTYLRNSFQAIAILAMKIPVCNLLGNFLVWNFSINIIKGIAFSINQVIIVIKMLIKVDNLFESKCYLIYYFILKSIYLIYYILTLYTIIII